MAITLHKGCSLKFDPGGFMNVFFDLDVYGTIQFKLLDSKGKIFYASEPIRDLSGNTASFPIMLTREELEKHGVGGEMKARVTVEGKVYEAPVYF